MNSHEKTADAIVDDFVREQGDGFLAEVTHLSLSIRAALNEAAPKTTAERDRYKAALETERERCAKIAEKYADGTWPIVVTNTAEAIAEEIRRR